MAVVTAPGRLSPAVGDFGLLALWRLVAHYVSTPTEYFSTPAKAKAIMETSYLYEYKPSPTSRLHACNIIRAMENTPPAYANRAYLEANARWLNGNQLADALGIGQPPVYYWAFMVSQCILYMAVCYTCRAFSILDRHQIKSFRKIMWSVVESKEWGLGSPSTFDFKYVPGYGIYTKDEGDVKERKAKVFWTADRSSTAISLIVALISYVGMFASWKAAFWFWSEGVVRT